MLARKLYAILGAQAFVAAGMLAGCISTGSPTGGTGTSGGGGEPGTTGTGGETSTSTTTTGTGTGTGTGGSGVGGSGGGAMCIGETGKGLVTDCDKMNITPSN